jgi:outer membrane receptor protein involved in Fe transport
LLFDGIRLNNSTYRQGPNQYFFTLDSSSIESIEVLRGGASTEYGSDALGGVVAANPIEPPQARERSEWHPRLFLRGATADREYGGRLQLNASAPGGIGFVGGLGGRRIGLLESAGPVRSPVDGQPSEVPRFAADGRTQLGTGFDEVTFDGRFVYTVNPRHKLTLAGYGYQQYNAPRTDQCPPPTARFDECLSYDEQFRTLLYAAWEGELGSLVQGARVTLSWQRQHERRTHSRPASFVVSQGRDDVDTLGISAKGRTALWHVTPWLSLGLLYGADTSFDQVDSRAWLGFTDVGITVERTRGQYLTGSTYLSGGAFAEVEAHLLETLVLRLGGRASWISARAQGDKDSGSLPIRRDWQPFVGHLGAQWAATEHLTFLANIDRSFRAPNLDDLTSRQQTGPGFQFENPSLEPERATTIEVGARFRAARPLTFELWAFRTVIDGAVGKQPMEILDCPPQTPQCQASWLRYRLVNARGSAEILGLELAAKVHLPRDFTARATVAWAWGDGPNLAAPPSNPNVPYEPRVPLSRVPPLNGTAELDWRHPTGFGAGAAVRWAALQDRLAIADRSDARIPLGGTPGFVVVDLRVSYRLATTLTVAGVVENLLDAAYRYHGSSVNGPGRGVVLSLSYSPI